MGTISGSAPENWELLLHFIPAPPEMTVYPVIELPTSTASPVPSTTPGKITPTEPSLPDPVATSTPSNSAFYLTLDRAVQLDDSFILYATFHWDSDLYPFVSPGMAKLLDADGRAIPIEYADPDFSAASAQQQPLAIKALGNFPPGPITLTIEEAHTELPAEGRFSFNVGSNPQPGDVWDLNQPVEVSGYTITILSVSAIDSHGHLGFEFKVDTGPDIESARLIDPEHPPMGGGGGGGGGSDETVRTTQLLYGDKLPTGQVTIAIQSIGLKLQGPWQATWTPAEDLQTASTSQDQASCLTSAAWKKAKEQIQTLPEIWAGKLAHYGPVSEGEDWYISIIDLDHDHEQFIGPGTWPALSPDGSRLVYSGSDGLYITDLATGEIDRLPGTNENDYNPLWSPDGSQIVFVRGAGAFDLYLITANGAELRQLTNSPAYENLGSWLPDGQHILFGEPNEDGLLLRLMNIRDGSIEDLFPIHATKDLSIAISPDGNRLAYMETVFGYKRGLFIANLDGSDRLFFGDADTEVFSNPLWSADGKWLLLSVWDEQVNDVLPFLALVQVDSCQIIPLPDMTGQFSSWVP
jgi:Tol biopolymer transport system component